MKNRPDYGEKLLLVTIDGPAGLGKTTVSKILAERLGYKYIDTGALYRGVAYEAQKAGVASDDDTGLGRLCDTLDFEFARDEKGLRLFSNGVDITGEIRTPDISMLALQFRQGRLSESAFLRYKKSLVMKKALFLRGGIWEPWYSLRPK